MSPKDMVLVSEVAVFRAFAVIQLLIEHQGMKRGLHRHRLRCCSSPQIYRCL